MSKANNPELTSWVSVPENSDFPIQNLPFGVFQTAGAEPRVGVAIGNQILDMAYLYEKGYFSSLGFAENIFRASNLNAYISTGKQSWAATRERVSDLLNSTNTELQNNTEDAGNALVNMQDAELLMPVNVPNYTDFYSSIEHATNVGKMFRPDSAPLLPNWKHIPVGYHGRASSICVSGTPTRRPQGQTLPQDADSPVFGNSRLLDFELEMGFVVGVENELGTPVSVNKAEDHIFGMMIFNDWSARDIQKWEYVPLGPFLGKNFASTISPWIVPLDALEPFRTKGPEQDPAPLAYMQHDGEHTFDIQLEVYIQPENGEATRICESNFKYLYWSMAQQLAHHTIGGCNMQVGDICASGTISGAEPHQFGSMLELSWKGTKPLQMADGTERKFLLDGDTVIMKAFCQSGNRKIGFGEVRSQILPALS